MKNFLFHRSDPTRSREAASQPAESSTPRRVTDPAQLALDQRFIALLSQYRGSGGLARLDEVMHLFNRQNGPGVDALARWIASRHAIGFSWRSQTWVPLFQFTACDLMPAPAIQPVLAELNPLYDPLSLAEWFARPHELLGNSSPVQALLTNPCSVLAAARVDKTMAGLRQRTERLDEPCDEPVNAATHFPFASNLHSNTNSSTGRPS